MKKNIGKTQQTRPTVGAYSQEVAKAIYDKVLRGQSDNGVPFQDSSLPDPEEILLVQMRETLPPYDFWRATNPSTGDYYTSSDYSGMIGTDYSLAKQIAPVYATACGIVHTGTYSGDLFGSVVEVCTIESDDEPYELYYNVFNRDPNIFAMKGDWVYIKMVDGEYTIVAGARNELEGITMNSADASTDILQSSTAANYSEVRLIYRDVDDPSASCKLTAWSEAVPNLYESLDIDEYVHVRIKRVNGVWQYTSIGCEELASQNSSIDSEPYGEFDGRSRWNEVKSEFNNYYTGDMNDEGN